MKNFKNYLKTSLIILLALVSCNKENKIVNTPPIIKTQSFIVPENLLSGEKIGDVNASDSNKDELKFSIITNDNDLFVLSPSGVLSVALGKTLDYETKKAHRITVQVTDGKENVTAEIVINVIDIDENQLPVISAQNFTVAENISDSEIIGTVIATDLDNDPLTFSIETDNEDLFKITDLGELSLIEGKELDYETKTSHKIIIQVTDKKASNSAEITINVTDIDEGITIPDTNFKSVLLANTLINTNGDDEIQIAEADAYTGSINVINKNITDLTGIESFTKITTLLCANNKLTKLDLSLNVELENLNCLNNQLTELNLFNNTKLLTLNCDRNNITSLDVSNSNQLKIINCGDNKLSSINISNKSELEVLNCWSNQLTNINTSNNLQLKEFNCSNNLLTTINVLNNTALLILKCAQNKLANLDLSSNEILENLTCWSNELINLNVSKNIKLNILSFEKNKVSSIDISNNNKLKFIKCGENQLTNLDTSTQPMLEQLFASSNQLTKIDISNNKKMKLLFCNNNLLSELDIANTNNASINNFNSENNPNLTCIKIDNGFTPPNNWRKDDIANYNNICN